MFVRKELAHDVILPVGFSESKGNPRCRSEVRRWQQGDYTLVHDTNTEGAEFALDAVLFCACRGMYFCLGKV